MTFGSSSSPTEPLSVGNVVSAAFRLYQTNAKQYFGIALVAVGWSLLPVLAGIVVGLIIAFVVGSAPDPTVIFGIFVLALVAIIVLAVYCVAKSLANSALISRLAFGELSNQPQSLPEARRFVNSRKWSFWVVQLLLGLIVVGAVLGFAIVGGVLGGIGAAIGGTGSGVSVLIGLLIALLVIAAIVFFVWLSARLVGAEVPLAVEAQSSAGQSIGRFWELTKGSVWRIALVLLIAAAITLPIYLVGQLISIIPQAILAALLPNSTDPTNAAAYGVFTVLSTLVSYAISLLLNILVLPFWQAVKAVLYYDLRNRREGLNLQLRDRNPR